MNFVCCMYFVYGGLRIVECVLCVASCSLLKVYCRVCIVHVISCVV